MTAHLASRPIDHRASRAVKHHCVGGALRNFIGLLLALNQMGCAHHEAGHYQIARLKLTGQRELAEQPALSCLISRERPRVSLNLGLGDPSCGEAPFDSQAPRLNLWRWWWTDWPAFNRAVFDEDLERIVRWYRARGYYDARIVEVSFKPQEASDPGAKSSCNLDTKVCPVRIVVSIEEGLPTFVEQADVEGLERLPPDSVTELKKTVQLQVQKPIDEANYEETKRRIYLELREHGYARAEVQGTVEVRTDKRSARVHYRVDTGEIYTFGELRLKGAGKLRASPILAAADLPTGERYSPQTLTELQAQVYALGAFSSVQVQELYRDKEHKVDVLLEVSPRAPHEFRTGIGVLSGAQQRTSTGELASIPQWDVHLFGRYERRQLWRTLGRLILEERPRMIFSEDFPRTTVPKFGNVVSLRLNQPGLIEKRTDLFTENAWDYGPDAFLGFLRSDIYFRLGARRSFLRRKLAATLSVQQDLFLVGKSTSNLTSDGSELPSTYGYSFVEEDLRLDLRDNPARPQSGAYLGLNTTQAPHWAGSDWTAYRVGPEVRGYIPLFLDIVWANRFALAGLFITDASPHLDETSEALGPNAYRLRGGGANSNRGFLAGQLGAGLQGGVRRWEASSELRVPFGRHFVLAGFADLGDVNDQPSWRFDYLNLTLGWGLRFYTILGAIRLDTGLRVPSLQRADGSSGIGEDDSKLFGAPGAIHLTIGDAF
jgi:outer membrane protein assembly factor BamA